MVKLTKRIAVYVGSLVFLTALYTTVYRWGMATLEGEERSWYVALEIVVQSMTTTGYGQDAPWVTPEMTVLMVLIQLTGITYIFVAVPLFVVPWLETLVQPTPPEHVDELVGHVIVVGYTDLCGSLVQELESSGTRYVIVEEDEQRAQNLHEDGFVVLHGEPATDETLDAAQLEDAIAVVVDASEREHLTTVIGIEQREFETRILALVADPSRARYLRYAGADEVLSPKHRLGKALGDKIRNVVDARLDDPVDEGGDIDGRNDGGERDDGRGGDGNGGWDDGDRNGAVERNDRIELDGTLRVMEYPIDEESDLVGESLAACRRVESDGATVLGAWVRGDFLNSLPADVRADEYTTLLVVGTRSDLEVVADVAGADGAPYRPEREPIVVVGTGVVGSTIVGDVRRAGLETTVVDREDGDLVDVVGDVTTEETLAEAIDGGPGSIVLALDDDEDAIVATLVARELDPEIEILVATDRETNVSRLRAAGANYALGLPNVTGRMLTLRVFDHEVMTFGDRVFLRRFPSPTSAVEDRDGAGDRLDPGTIRERTGCSIVAIERNGRLHTDVDGCEIVSGDQLVVAGARNQIASFRDVYEA